MRAVSFAAMIVLALGGSTSCSMLTSFDGFGGGGASSGSGSSGGSSSGASSSGASSSGGSSSGGNLAPYPAAILADKPLGYWRFGEASGNTAADETGNNNTAVIGTGVTWGATGAILHDSNTAVSLAGKQCLEVGGDSFDFPGTNAFSLEGWFTISAPPDNVYRHLYVKDDPMNPAGRQEYGVYLENNDGLSFERFVNSGSKNIVTPAPPLNEWTYFVATYDGTQLVLYVNAANVGSVPDTRAQLPITNAEYMGCKSFNYPGVEGAIDEFAIYDKALTQTQILAHYAASGH
jgi:hypothetical protein